jgi:hypothetical protein
VRHRFNQPLTVLALLVCSLLTGLAVIFVAAYATNVPVHDQWWASIDVALATSRGALTPADIFSVTYDHLFVTSNLITALNTWLFDWYLPLEMYLNLLLVLLNALVLVGIAWHVDKRYIGLYAMLIFLLIFSFRTRTSWLWSLTIAHYMAYLCLYAGLLLLVRHQKRHPWRTIGGLTLCALVAVYSFASGVLVVAVFALALWLYDYRKKRYWLVWLSLNALLLIPFFLVRDAGSNWTDLPAVLQYAVSLAAAPLTPEGYKGVLLSLIVLASGGALALISWHGYRQHLPALSLRPLRPFALIGLFGVLSYGSVLYGRAGYGMEHYARATWYAMLMTPLWLALLGSVVYVMIRLVRRQTWHVYANTALLLLLSGCYLISGHLAAADGALFDEDNLDCARDFPLSREIECAESPWFNSRFTLLDQGDALAWQQLALYADDPDPVYLTEEPSDDDRASQPLDDRETAAIPGVIDLPLIWQHLHLERRLLPRIPDEYVLHLFQPDQPETPSRLPDVIPFLHRLTDIERTAGLQTWRTHITEDVSHIWYVTTADFERSERSRVVTDWLNSRMWFALGDETTIYEGLNLAVLQYGQQMVTYQYDEDIFLHDWQTGDVQVQPCDAIEIQQTWRVDKPLPDDVVTYAASILVNAAGEELERTEAVLLPEWETNWLYRTSPEPLGVPCDTPPGDYVLLTTVYTYDEFTDEFIENATIQAADGSASAGYLTTFFVNE